jgi:hypothetical protein
LVGIDLQEHVTDPKCRALAMGDDNLDLSHVVIIVGTHGGCHPNCHAQMRSFDRMPPESVRTQRAGHPAITAESPARGE